MTIGTPYATGLWAMALIWRGKTAFWVDGSISIRNDLPVKSDPDLSSVVEREITLQDMRASIGG